MLQSMTQRPDRPQPGEMLVLDCNEWASSPRLLIDDPGTDQDAPVSWTWVPRLTIALVVCAHPKYSMWCLVLAAARLGWVHDSNIRRAEPTDEPSAVP